MKPIWFKPVDLDDLKKLHPNTLVEHIGIELTELGPDFLRGRMPVDKRTHQPFGLLHGGASVVLAETLGSIGAALVVDSAKKICVGQEINANHLRGVRDGFVIGTARPFHVGSSSQVWGIEIRDDKDGKLVCVSRITMAVLNRPA
jgi:1,4-dihydroxy-2-naphthoyl-CoA hydrolase